MAQAYCMKCRRKAEVRNRKWAAATIKRWAVQTLCPKCGRNKVSPTAEQRSP